jgi:hypothetical protein
MKNEMKEKYEVVKKGGSLITGRKVHGTNIFSLGKVDRSIQK